MIKFSIFFRSILMLTAGFASMLPLYGQKGPVTNSVPLRMTISLSVANDKRMPEVTRDDVIVKQGKNRLRITSWTPAREGYDGLNLFILIDDSCDPILSSHFDDLRTFIGSLPKTTAVGVGYMRNATVQIAQNFTDDHSQAANALRIPTGSMAVYGSPYLSVIDLIKRWPVNENRREIVMITDGIDRFRVRSPGFRTLNITPDLNLASDLAQRTGTISHTIYAPGVGRFYRNYWEANNGQLAIARLSDETGGESYFLGFQNPVSLAPYLSDLQTVLENQYLLRFEAVPGKRAGLQNIALSTEVAGVDLSSANGVWVVPNPQ